VSGLRPLLLKELLESRRTLRLPIVVGLFAFVGILSPLTAKYLPEILTIALGDQLTVPIPTPTAADAVLQLQKNLGQFGALAAIVLAMGSVATEKERGTAAFVLTKPASRASFLAAKLLGLAAVLALATAVGVALAWVYTAVLFAPPSVPGWIAMGFLAWLALLAWAALTFLASTVSRSAAAAAGIGFVALLGISLVSAIPPVGRWLPPGLDGPAQALAAGLPVDGADLASATIGTVALIVACVGAAWLSFRRQEL
jgi:ABC-2 type transport system permease protein